MSSRDLLDLIWLVPALPLAGATFLLLFGKRLGEPRAGWIGTGVAALSFVWSVVTFVAIRDVDHRTYVREIFDWIPAGGFQVTFGFLVDPLSVTMLLFITGVGTLIHLYSIGYMHGDPRFSRFFGYMNLFLASMLVLVLGSSFLVTFLGWEGVGVCSYLLISFWFERDTAAVAGKKAFVTNRVGDLGFMLAMFLIFSKLGTLDYAGLSEQAESLTQGTATVIALLLLLGAVGKSAQLPLHVWLPDAMEGPTPVSALIHAATMVTAGVYLVCRTHPFFEVGSAGEVVAWVGAITALFAATVALVHNDIKKVLAYSTISQIGYMFLAAGVGAYSASMFHMVTHAFFKALLFLGAGSVIHAMRDRQDMRRMGGLRRYLPVTAATFIVGWLAIAGIFPFAGFWSKDEILAQVWFSGSYALWAIGALTALLTAFYMTRQVRLVFFGDERWSEPLPARSVGAAAATDTAGDHDGDDGAGHEIATPHESPPIMLLPLVVLALLSAVAGFLNLPFRSLEFLGSWLEPVFEDVHRIHPTSFAAGFALSTVALAIAVLGIAVAGSVYKRGLLPDGEDPMARRLGPLQRLFSHAWYLDEGLAALVGGPVRRAADWLASFDRGGIDGVVDGVGSSLQRVGSGLRVVQSGLVRVYALMLAAGAAAILLYLLVRTG